MDDFSCRDKRNPIKAHMITSLFVSEKNPKRNLDLVTYDYLGCVVKSA